MSTVLSNDVLKNLGLRERLRLSPPRALRDKLRFKEIYSEKWRKGMDYGAEIW